MRPRLRPRSPRAVDQLIIASVVALATAVYTVYALRVATFQADEELYLRVARNLAGNFPAGLWQAGVYTRGLQRLDPLLLAAPFSLLRGPGAFEVDHVIQCLLFASTAVPVFLLGRRAGVGRAGSHLAAVLAITAPWAVVSTSFLSESAAYPAFAWTLYAVWLAACEPRLRHEIFAIAAVVVAALSRTALLSLAPLLPLTVLWQASRVGSVRTLPTRLWRDHRLVTVLSVVALTAYLLYISRLLPGHAGQSLTGSYGLPHVEPLSALMSRYRYYLSRDVAGTGFLAAAFGIPWVLGTLMRARDERLHGLAVVCLLALLCMLLSLLQAGPDERYVLYGAVPIALAFAAALEARVGVGVLVGGVLIVLLIDSVSWPPLANLYDFFTYPSAIFYSRVLVNHAATLPLVHGSPDRVIEGALLLAAVAWVVLRHIPRAVAPATVAVALIVLALSFTQTAYTLVKYTNGAGHGPSASERSWIDRHVPSGAHVTALAVSNGTTLNYLPIWREAEFWNTSINGTAFFGSPGYAPFPLGSVGLSLSAEPGSGLVSASISGRPAPVPRLLLVPRVTALNVGFDVEQSLEDPALLINLVRLREPARLDWSLTGISTEGFMASGQPVTVDVYSGALQQGERCASLSLLAPPNFTGRWPYRVLEGKRTLSRGSLAAQQGVTLTMPLQQRSTPHGPAARVQIRVDGSVPYPGGAVVSARVGSLTLHRCPA